jgi:hypothetical protein
VLVDGFAALRQVGSEHVQQDAVFGHDLNHACLVHVAAHKNLRADGERARPVAVVLDNPVIGYAILRCGIFEVERSPYHKMRDYFDLSRLALDVDLDVDELRARLSRMSDRASRIRARRSLRVHAIRESGAVPAKAFVLQLEAARPSGAGVTVDRLG